MILLFLLLFAFIFAIIGLYMSSFWRYIFMLFFLALSILCLIFMLLNQNLKFGMQEESKSETFPILGLEENILYFTEDKGEKIYYFYAQQSSKGKELSIENNASQASATEKKTYLLYENAFYKFLFSGLTKEEKVRSELIFHLPASWQSKEKNFKGEKK